MKAKSVREDATGKKVSNTSQTLGKSFNAAHLPMWIMEPTLQRRSLQISSPQDKYEREADAIANQVMRQPTSSVQRRCACGGIAGADGECAACKAKRLQREVASSSAPSVTSGSEAPASVHQTLAQPGQALDTATRHFMESRFGQDFSHVRVHTDSQAAQSAADVNARAYTVGSNIVFGAGQYAPRTTAGQTLVAHELAHTLQQGDWLRCQDDEETNRASTGTMQLEFRPTPHGTPCACVVFIHNNERNARRAAENLHRHCRYNLAVIESGRQRRIPVPGTSDDVDPNELFSQDIVRQCTTDEASCRAYVASHNNLRAMQMQFFLAIKDCTRNFSLPAVALHNNDISETRQFRDAVPGIGHRIAALMEDIRAETRSGRGSREDLRARLQSVSEGTSEHFEGLMDARGTTNIFRWCNADEISRCHIGDPFHPDFVIWTTNVADYELLEQAPVNVVLQATSANASGTESESDLSTLFSRMGSDARYINIETPISPTNEETRLNNMIFILQNLTRLGLNCCDVPADEDTEAR